MRENDTRLFAISDLGGAIGLLTRLPFGGVGRGAASSWAWPVVGAGVGAMAAAVGVAAVAVGVAPGAAAALALAVQAMLTGGLHEDGLSDTFDGLMGGRDAARRLEIMRDSRIGSFGALALVLVVLMRWSALVVLLAAPGAVWAVVAAAALSRAVMPVIMAAVPPARLDGLSRMVGRPGPVRVILAVLVAVALAVPAAGWGLASILGALAFGMTALALWARARIGGQTGDILGAAQQLAEALVLTLLAAQVTS